MLGVTCTLGGACDRTLTAGAGATMAGATGAGADASAATAGTAGAGADASAATAGTAVACSVASAATAGTAVACSVASAATAGAVFSPVVGIGVGAASSLAVGSAAAGCDVSITMVVVSTTRAVFAAAPVGSASLIDTPSALRDAPKYFLSSTQRYQLVRAKPVRSGHIPRFLR